MQTVTFDADKYVLVPTEPTDEMLLAACGFCDFDMEIYKHIYKAMIAAYASHGMFDDEIIALYDRPAEQPSNAETPSRIDTDKPSYDELQAMYAGQCQLTDDYAERLKEKSDATLLNKIKELHEIIAKLNVRIMQNNFNALSDKAMVDELVNALDDILELPASRLDEVSMIANNSLANYRKGEK